jgi:hypothetical protein
MRSVLVVEAHAPGRRMRRVGTHRSIGRAQASAFARAKRYYLRYGSGSGWFVRVVHFMPDDPRGLVVLRFRTLSDLETFQPY